MSDKEVKIKKRGGSKGAIVACCAIGIAIVAIIVAVVYVRQNSSTDESTDGTKRNVVVNEDNVEEVLAELSTEELTSNGYYNVQMNTTWTFEDGTAVSEDAYVKNAATNTNDVYFDVTLADTEELVYSSPIIPLGSYLKDIALDTDLDAGTYDAIITYHLVDDDMEDLSSVSMYITIDIQN